VIADPLAVGDLPDQFGRRLRVAELDVGVDQFFFRHLHQPRDDVTERDGVHTESVGAVGQFSHTGDVGDVRVRAHHPDRLVFRPPSDTGVGERPVDAGLREVGDVAAGDRTVVTGIGSLMPRFERIDVQIVDIGDLSPPPVVRRERPDGLGPVDDELCAPGTRPRHLVAPAESLGVLDAEIL
jgi:hypothetical protein